MHTKTMEGLAGTGTNMKLLNTPFRVFKDAERRGDTAVMVRYRDHHVHNSALQRKGTPFCRKPAWNV